MSEKARFHPLALVINFLKVVKNLGFALFFLGIQLYEQPYFFWVASAIFLLSIGFVLRGYAVNFYQITPDHVIIYKGLFNKKETFIPYKRMQTIKKRQWFFLKPFQLVQVLIETAGGSGEDAEASLPVIKESEFQQIENYRRLVNKQPAKINESDEQPSEEQTTTITVTNRQLVMFTLTDSNLLVGAVASVFFISEYVPNQWLQQLAGYSQVLLDFNKLVLLTVFVLLMLVITALLIIKNAVKYYHFSTKRHGDTLTITNGLFERKTQTIPVEKIQGVRLKQSIIRNIAGLISVELILAGGQDDEESNQTNQTLYLLPIISEKEVFAVCHQLLPEWSIEKVEWRYPSRQNVGYYLRWKLAILLVIAGVIGYFWPIVGAVLAAVFFIGLLLFGWFVCRYQGYHLPSNSYLCIQKIHLFSKTQTYLAREKVQSVTNKTSFQLYKKQIGHFSLHFKEGAQLSELSLSFVSLMAIKELKGFFYIK